MFLFSRILNALNVAGDTSQSAFDVQYEVPATEGEFSRLRRIFATCLSHKKTLMCLFFPLTQDAEAAFGDSDDDQRDDAPPSTQTAKPTEDHQGNNGIQKPGQPQTSSAPSTAALPAPGQPSQSTRDSVLHSASLSLQEQHATNILLETVSRSLELLSESVQQLAETQQEFVRESLQLQRETVQVLRDFTGGAIALMHDKLNGRPAL